MKKLNKYYKNCPLNKKLRRIYSIKQKINNSDLEKDFKLKLMRDCDLEIHKCWDKSYNYKKGYEIS